MEYEVEGRYFPTNLYAFTFAQIQADRMHRAVEVHISDPYDRLSRTGSWHATAHPEEYRRTHLVKEGVM